MPLTILLTGFGPFPGAPYNPTGPLVRALALRRHRAFARVRRIAHVFSTRYDTVDRELPELIERVAPDIIIMFGLAQRSQHLRIESLARNALSRMHADASGRKPVLDLIVPGAPATLRLQAPLQRLVAAARASGMPARLSRDAGRYLCNYLCWRASEHTQARGKPYLVAFVHVPRVSRSTPTRRRGRAQVVGPPFTLSELIRAGEAIMLAALTASRGRR